MNPRLSTEWLRYLAGHLAVGSLAAAVFITALMATDAAGLATGADWVDREGIEHHQSADVVVLGAGPKAAAIASGFPDSVPAW